MSSSETAAQHLPRTEARSLSGHEGAVLAVRFNRDGNYCLSCGKDRTLRLWNPHTGAHVKTYKSHAREVRDVHSSSYVRTHVSLAHLSLSPFIASQLIWRRRRGKFAECFLLFLRFTVGFWAGITRSWCPAAPTGRFSTGTLPRAASSASSVVTTVR